MVSTVPTEQRIEAACERLQRTRGEMFALTHQLVGNYAPDDERAPVPRSRLMRLLTGKGGRMLLSGAALAATLLPPSMFWRAGKAVGLLRPLLLRYVLPRLLR